MVNSRKGNLVSTDNNTILQRLSSSQNYFINRIWYVVFNLPDLRQAVS